MTITHAMRQMMTPGTCTRCQTYSTLDRNSAGECTDCHNLGNQERRAARTAQLDQRRAEGRAYWQGRGIQVGQRVTNYAVSMLLATSHKVYGIAKVGVVGAYVSSQAQRGYLSPNGWTAA